MANKTNLFRAAALAGFAAVTLWPAVGLAQSAYGQYGQYGTMRPWQPGYDAAAAPRPDFPGAKQFDPANPAFLGAGNNRAAALGMTGAGSPSKEELAKHKAYVESLRQQKAYK
jgi:hypothetical protein